LNDKLLGVFKNNTRKLHVTCAGEKDKVGQCRNTNLLSYVMIHQDTETGHVFLEGAGIDAFGQIKHY